MKQNTQIANAEAIFGLVQYYGEKLQIFRHVLDQEDDLLLKNHFVPEEVGRLLDLREQRCYLGMALKTVANELQEKHGFSIPDINGWRLADKNRFHEEPFPSLSDKLR